MKRLLSIRALFSLGLLWLAASALVLSLKVSILGLTDAAFLPVTVTAMVMAYLLGFGNWPARRAWVFLLSFSPFLILLEATRTAPALWQIFIHLPGLVISVLFGWITGKPLDFSFFQIQLAEILTHLEVFLRGLTVSSNGPDPILLEVMWDVPLFLVSAWAGWWSSRRSSILIALIPSLAVQAFLLNYARRSDGLTLQIGIFAFIFLLGLHQKWSLSKSENKTQVRVRLETYGLVLTLSSVLIVTAGLAPIIPTPEKTPAPKKEQLDVVKEVIEKKVVPNNPGPPSGLPRDHLINNPPENLMDVIFLANTGEAPFLDEDNTGIEPDGQLYYWRWITYDLYNGKAWSSSPTTSTSYSADQPLFEYSGEGYRMVHQSIIKASAGDEHLYWTGSLIGANQPIDTTWRTLPLGSDPILQMDMLGSLTQAQQYSADSLLPQFNEAQLREASRVYPTEILQKYLVLPEDKVSQRVRDLAATLTFEPQNPYDKAKAIEAYLRTYPYTLDVPAVPVGKEIADYFLFDLKTGYCEYYATSMVVLARSVGLPARMVIGYASNEYDSRTAQYIVREVHAHSWVEIYFPEIGWVEFEPTASQPLIRQPMPAEDLNIQIPVTPTIKDRAEIIYEKQGFFVGRSPIFAILLSIFTLLGICLWYLRMQGLWFSYKTIGSMYEYIYHHGRKIVPGAPPNATPSLFAEKLKAKLSLDHQFLLPAADELDQLTSLYLKETYSPHPVTQDEQEQAVKIWHKLFWRLLYVRVIPIKS